MKTKASDTPRTDAALLGRKEWEFHPISALCRQLERELNEERARRQECERQLIALQSFGIDRVAELKIA